MKRKVTDMTVDELVSLLATHAALTAPASAASYVGDRVAGVGKFARALALSISAVQRPEDDHND